MIIKCNVTVLRQSDIIYGCVACLLYYILYAEYTLYCQSDPTKTDYEQTSVRLWLVLFL